IIFLRSCFLLDVYSTHILALFPTHATLHTPNHLPRVSLRGCHPLYPRHSTGVRVGGVMCAGVRTPHRHRLSAAASVCSVTSSIAFTEGIPIGFFSSPY